MKGKSLGKGIGALIPEYSEPDGDKREIAEINIDTIKFNHMQPRQDFSQEALEELAVSIRENGLVQPITVRKVGDDFELIAGERRLRALKILNVRTVPVYILQVDDDRTLLELALIENIQREDLNSIDLANAYKDLSDAYGLSHGEIADKVGKDRTTVTNSMRLLTLPEDVQHALRRGSISMGHARAMLGLEDTGKIMRLFRMIINEELSVRQVEKLVKSGMELSAVKSTPKPKTVSSPHLRAVESDLMMKFGTKTKLRERGSGGEIIIEYYSDDDLERLLELFGKLND